MEHPSTVQEVSPVAPEQSSAKYILQTFDA